MEQEQDPKPSMPGFTEALGEAASNPDTPRSSGEDLWAIGRWWKVASCEARIKAQFEQYVRRRAKESVKDAMSDGDNEEADKLRSSYQSDLAAGQYSWQDSELMGESIRKAITSVTGSAYLLFLLMRRCKPDITEETTNKIYKEHVADVVSAIRWALGNSSAPSSQDGAKPTMDN